MKRWHVLICIALGLCYSILAHAQSDDELISKLATESKFGNQANDFLQQSVQNVEQNVMNDTLTQLQLFSSIRKTEALQRYTKNCMQKAAASIKNDQAVQANINKSLVDVHNTHATIQQDLIAHQKQYAYCAFFNYKVNKLYAHAVSQLTTLNNLAFFQRNIAFVDHLTLQAPLFLGMHTNIAAQYLHIVLAWVLSLGFIYLTTKLIPKLRAAVLFYKTVLAVSSIIYVWILYHLFNQYLVVPFIFFNFVPILYFFIVFRSVSYNLAKAHIWFTIAEAWQLSIWCSGFFLCLLAYTYAAQLCEQQYILASICNWLAISLIAIMNYCLCAILLFINYKYKLYKDFFLTHPKAIPCMIYILYGITILLSITGYFQAALSLIIVVVASIFLLLIIMDVTHFYGQLYIAFSSPEKIWSQRLRKWLGMSTEKKLIELFGLRIIATMPIYFYAVYAFLELWGMTLAIFKFKQWMYEILTGITVFDITIQPKNLIRSYTLFYIMLVLSRVIATYIDKHYLEQNQQTKRFFINFARYCIILFSIVLILKLNDVDLRGVLVITGALSVGIGLGLQHFASDFMSGLLILINKPIQVGDHILIRHKEGYVKQIGLLSTRLLTPAYADLIIPNSKIVKKSLTNFTYNKNKAGLITIPIALNDPMQHVKAKQLLLEVAANNKDIKQRKPYKPVVLFKANYLELNCLAHDINHKNNIMSALTMAIIEVFHTNNIEMSFGVLDQQDKKL